jgi:hypothetical protein
VESLAKVNYSSLLLTFVNLERKKFYDIDTSSDMPAKGSKECSGESCEIRETALSVLLEISFTLDPTL